MKLCTSLSAVDVTAFACGPRRWQATGPSAAKRCVVHSGSEPDRALAGGLPTLTGIPEQRFSVLVIGLAGALALAVGLLTVNHVPVGGFYDDGFYVILAKSLATGQGYRYLN